MSDLVIAKGNLKMDMLKGMVVLLTGGGGGIGYEAARSLVWLGAKVAIAEINKEKGLAAEKKLAADFGRGKAFFYHVDISDEKSVATLCHRVAKEMGEVDVLVNNASIAPIGAAHKVGIAQWDLSYGVNLRGAVLLLEQLLPGMLDRKCGAVVFAHSFGAAPFMGAYEVFKTAQGELCSTLAEELEGTGVFTFSIIPGMVKTDTADQAIEQIAPLYGKSVQEFYAMNEAGQISAEQAGAGLAAAVALADQYNGTKTSVQAALADAGISAAQACVQQGMALSQASAECLGAALAPVLETYRQQSDVWRGRSGIERQRVLEDFKRNTGLSVDQAMEALRQVRDKLTQNELPEPEYDQLFVGTLRSFYMHQKEIMMSHEKDRIKAATNAAVINGWTDDIDEFERIYREVTAAMH